MKRKEYRFPEEVKYKCVKKIIWSLELEGQTLHAILGRVGLAMVVRVEKGLAEKP